MILKYGDSGQRVSQMQKMLSFIGYDLIVDGFFGKVTLRSLKAFQKKVGLVTDGMASQKTITALKSSQKRTAKEDGIETTSAIYPNYLNIDTSNELPREQYNRQQTIKKQIFIHFTAGSSSAKNTIHGWNSNISKIATAFVVDGDNGQIFEAFNPNYWGWHLGIKGTKGSLDKISIGIEMCAFGPLKKKGNDFYAWPPVDPATKQAKYETKVDKSNIYSLNESYRGFLHFYAYSDEQLENLEKLLSHLIEIYNIPVQKEFNESWFDFKPELIANKTPGIWTHVNVRKDKTDSYPDHRLLEVLNRIAKKYN